MGKDEKLIYTNEPRKLCVTPGWNDFLANVARVLAEHNLVLKGSKETWRGTSTGLSPVDGLNDIHVFLEDCDRVEVTEDSEGRLNITGTHHDGKNRAELCVIDPAYKYDKETRPPDSALQAFHYTGRFDGDLREHESEWPEPCDWLREYAASNETPGTEWHSVASDTPKLVRALKAVSDWVYERAPDPLAVDGYLEDWGNPGEVLIGIESDDEVRGSDVFASLHDLFVILETLEVSPVMEKMSGMDREMEIIVRISAGA